MNHYEEPVLFECEGHTLVGVLSLPASPRDIGIVVVVGGPQYRAGSHRQFVHLARYCAQHGIAVLRFDYRGMGDSEGDPRSFTAVDADIAAAVMTLMCKVPQVRQVVLWGLCDGASAALMAARSISTVTGVVALNPWVRTETSLDQTLITHYYTQRIVSREFWVKLLTGKLGLVPALGEFSCRAASAFAGRFRGPKSHLGSTRARANFQDRMLDGLKEFSGSVVLVLSGKDLTAQEFLAFTESEPHWKRALANSGRVVMHHLPEADHTFSSPRWRAEVERLSCGFVLALRDPT